MDNNDLERFHSALDSCWSILANNKKLEQIILKIYYDSLIKFSIEEVEYAFTKSIMTLKWFPKPVELIEMITGSDENQGDIEASKVIEMIKSKGAYSSVEFENKTTQAVINRFFGGWIKLCEDLKEDEIKWFFKEFAQFYKSLKAAGIEDHEKLTGIFGNNDEIKQLGDVLKKIELKEN